jgi:hypothetical protein
MGLRHLGCTVHSIHQHQWPSSYAMKSHKPAAMCLGFADAVLAGFFGIRPEFVAERDM